MCYDFLIHEVNKTYLDLDCRKCIKKQKHTIFFYPSLKWYWVCKSILLNHLIWHWNKIWEVLCNPLVFSLTEYIIGTLKIRNNSWCPTFLYWPLFSYHSTNFAIVKVVALNFGSGFVHCIGSYLLSVLIPISLFQLLRQQ